MSLSLERFLNSDLPDEPTRRTLLILDRSWSMAETDANRSRIEVAMEACCAVVRTKRLRHPRDDLGMIVFNAEATVVWEMTPAERLPAAVNLQQIQLGDNTNISAGLRWAESHPGIDQVVLLTDGEHNTGEHPVPVAAALKASGVQIDVIGIGNETDLDQTMLRQIATTDRLGVVHYQFVGDLRLLAGHLIRVAERRIMPLKNPN